MTEPGAGERVLWVGRGLADVGGIDPTHRAVLVDGDQIAWTGSDPADAPAHDRVEDLGAAWLTPGFVDAHVHATATGLERVGVALAGARSLEDALARVRAHVARVDPAVVHGTGWDDQAWPEQRPPTADELLEAAGGRPTVLFRVDGHSCVVDRGLLARLDLGAVGHHVMRDIDGLPTGWLLEEAVAVAQGALVGLLGPAAIDRARQETCRAALALGITSIHEMGIPELSDITDALAWATGPWPLEVHAYWADLAWQPGGPLRPGGDLFLDGSIGSCTAAASAPYLANDGVRINGELFHDDEAVTDFFVRATHAGLGAGVHAIGDEATGQAVRALVRAAEVCGVDAVRTARHRIEHLELVSRADVTTLGRLGVVASVQPAFDATWNGPAGLYEHRFGRDRADTTNPFSWLADDGVAMCFSSDSTVTPMDPWSGIRAAQHHYGGLAIDRRTALEAATIGGHVAVGREDLVGALLPGRRADIVAWPGDPLTNDVPWDWTPTVVLVAGHPT